MSLKNIVKGKIKKPFLVLLYGPDGVGKSTFGSEAPAPIFDGPESGTNNLDIARFTDSSSWAKIRSNVWSLIKEDHEFKTYVLDSLDWAEPLLWQALCEKYHADSIDEVAGGYGKGYGLANQEWKSYMQDLNKLRDRGMNVILIAHSQVKTFNDPAHPLPYDRYQLKLNDKASALFREFVDSVLFVNYDVTTFKLNKSDKKAKTQDSGARKIYTTRSASFDAKNRLGLPSEMPLSFSEFATRAGIGEPKSAKEILFELSEIAAKLDDETSNKMMKAVEAAKEDVTQLLKIKNHALCLVSEE